MVMYSPGCSEELDAEMQERMDGGEDEEPEEDEEEETNAAPRDADDPSVMYDFTVCG